MSSRDEDGGPGSGGRLPSGSRNPTGVLELAAVDVRPDDGPRPEDDDHCEPRPEEQFTGRGTRPRETGVAGPRWQDHSASRRKDVDRLHQRIARRRRRCQHEDGARG